MSFCRSILKITLPVLLLVLFCAASLHAGESPDLRFKAFEMLHAKEWQVNGNNIIVRGQVYLPFENYEIYADQAVINIQSQDIEAVGNIRIYSWRKVTGSVDTGKLWLMMNRPNTTVKVESSTGDIYGERKVNISADVINASVSAERMVGNLKSAYFRFDKAQLRFKTIVCRADSAERRANGIFNVKKAEISSCEYLAHDNAHYSIAANEATIYPYNTHLTGMEYIDTDFGDHSVWMTNGWAKIYGIPFLWLPCFYKPKDEHPGLFGVMFGKSSNYGYFVNMFRKFQLSDYPGVQVKLKTDWYSMRGVGYGGDVNIRTENSYTEFNAYSIYDTHPNESDDYKKYRLRVPNNRYNFRLTNVTHITPRLDFRGQFDYSSDYYFLRDFFGNRYSADPQPSTYAALEHQFDLFSVSTELRFRVNDFYTTVNKLPDIKISAQRQQIFNTPFYYQGNMDAAYMEMKWIDFDKGYKNAKGYETFPPNSKLKDYSSFRFDTTHFLYLPINLGWLNLVPRAGARLTAYSNTSKTKITEADLYKMFEAANVENVYAVPGLKNYDDKGGADARFLGELGAEASTTIHNTWRNVKSRFLGLDGLRHIMRPYVNYTFINDPRPNRDHLYYFDDVDRIQEQNFFRFGLENRLQTRSSDNSLRNYLKMENYIDIHLSKSDGYNNVGNFCTVLTFAPIQGLTFDTKLNIDLGNNNGDIPDVYRNGRDAGNPGISAKWLNSWSVGLTYEPLKDYKFSLAFDYSRPYASQSTFSMGSTIAQVDAGSYYNSFYTEHTQTVRFNGSLPITPDRRTFLSAGISYDFLDGKWDNAGFSLIRNFHCIQLIGTLNFSRKSEDKRAANGRTYQTKDWETNFTIQARLLGLEAPLDDGGAGDILNNLSNNINDLPRVFN